MKATKNLRKTGIFRDESMKYLEQPLQTCEDIL